MFAHNHDCIHTDTFIKYVLLALLHGQLSLDQLVLLHLHLLQPEIVNLLSAA